MQLVLLRARAVCHRCDSRLPPRTEAWWDEDAQLTTCETCERVDRVEAEQARRAAEAEALAADAARRAVVAAVPRRAAGQDGALAAVAHDAGPDLLDLPARTAARPPLALVLDDGATGPAGEPDPDIVPEWVPTNRPAAASERPGPPPNWPVAPIPLPTRAPAPSGDLPARPDPMVPPTVRVVPPPASGPRPEPDRATRRRPDPMLPPPPASPPATAEPAPPPRAAATLLGRLRPVGRGAARSADEPTPAHPPTAVLAGRSAGPVPEPVLPSRPAPSVAGGPAAAPTPPTEDPDPDGPPDGPPGGPGRSAPPSGPPAGEAPEPGSTGLDGIAAPPAAPAEPADASLHHDLDLGTVRRVGPGDLDLLAPAPVAVPVPHGTRAVDLMAPPPASVRDAAVVPSVELLERGDVGEGRVGQTLEGGRIHGYEVLHGLVVEADLAPVDHLVLAVNGLWVVAAVDVLEGKLQRVDVGDWFTADPRLHVGDVDRTDLVAGVRRQVEAVTRLLARTEFTDIPVRGALCFGSVQPGWVHEPFVLDGISVTWRRKLVEPLLDPVLIDQGSRVALLHRLLGTEPRLVPPTTTPADPDEALEAG